MVQSPSEVIVAKLEEVRSEIKDAEVVIQNHIEQLKALHKVEQEYISIIQMINDNLGN